MKFKVPLIIIILVTAFFVMAPWGLYELGLLNISGRPVAPANTVFDPKLAESIWYKSGERGTIRIDSLTPYNYFLSMIETGRLKGGYHIAWLVACDFNANNLKNKRMIWWHLSGIAMTIWLSQNWTTDQLLTQSLQIQNNKTRNATIK